VVIAGLVWVGDMAAARAYLPTFQAIGTPAAEEITEMSYVELQSIADDFHRHGLRRYSAGHYLPEFTDAAIDAFLSRGLAPGEPEPDWSRMPGGGFQAYGGAIADIPADASAFSYRDTLVEFFAGTAWTDPAQDDERMARARAWGVAIAPFSSGTYVNVLSELDAPAEQTYRTEALARLAQLKRKYDPDNVFHLNQNIRPAPATD
jgi:hypothetical protein